MRPLDAKCHLLCRSHIFETVVGETGRPRPDTVTVAVIGIIVWFGGQSVPALSDTVSCGAAVSATRTADAHDRALPDASRAVKVIGVVPMGSDAGASFDSVGDASQTSVAPAAAKNAASC